MSSKYVRGVKRNQIIQRWIQGIEDPDYEVFPTKKDGKYIVKLRENKISDPSETEPNNIQIKSQSDDIDSEPDVMQTTPSPNVMQTTPSPNVMQTKPSVPKMRNHDSNQQTINLEILEQLRNLGEEIRSDRYKREQKQYIKQIVNKELNKSRIRSKYVPDLIQPENDSTTPVQTPETTPEYDIPTPEPPIFRSRIRR